MSIYIPEKARLVVKERAFGLCEYCLIHETDSPTKFQIDHIISLKHGGINNASNFSYCCWRCNSNKGSDLGSILTHEDVLTRFYNPRKDKWTEHFDLVGNSIDGKTAIGKVTVKALQFNSERRLKERFFLIERNFFPHPHTLKYHQREHL